MKVRKVEQQFNIEDMDIIIGKRTINSKVFEGLTMKQAVEKYPNLDEKFIREAFKIANPNRSRPKSKK